jgi:hypothetical protein
MLFLACDLAIYRRLTGAPLDNKGNPVIDPATGKPVNTSIIGAPNDQGEVVRLPSYGIRIPLLKSPQKGQGDLSTLTPETVRLYSRGFEPHAFRQVPVFFDGFSGRDFSDIWPCVVVRSMTGLKYRSSNYEPGSVIQEEDSSATEVTITEPDGSTYTGKTSYLERAHPDPYDVTYVVTCYAKNKIDLGFMCEQIHLILQTGGGIDVEQMSGEVCTFDLLPGEITSVGSDELPALEGDRFFAMAFKYTVEAYADNSRNEFGVMDTSRTLRARTAIVQQILELEDIQGTLDWSTLTV